MSTAVQLRENRKRANTPSEKALVRNVQMEAGSFSLLETKGYIEKIATADLTNLEDAKDRRTLLMHCIIKGHDEIGELLIQRGVDVGYGEFKETFIFTGDEKCTQIPRSMCV
jgi:hypothetical protein